MRGRAKRRGPLKTGAGWLAERGGANVLLCTADCFFR